MKNKKIIPLKAPTIHSFGDPRGKRFFVGCFIGVTLVLLLWGLVFWFFVIK